MTLTLRPMSKNPSRGLRATGECEKSLAVALADEEEHLAERNGALRRSGRFSKAENTK